MTDKSAATVLPHGELTGRILDCFYETYGVLGHGFSEAVLRRAMAIVLEESGLQVVREGLTRSLVPGTIDRDFLR